ETFRCAKKARFPARSRRAGKRASLAAGKTGVKRKRSEDAAVPDGGDGAADLLFGPGQRKADIPLARRPEACARRADHAGLLDKFKAEGHAVLPAMGQRRPDKHAAVAVRQVPADGPQPAAQRVAPRLVNRALGAYA